MDAKYQKMIPLRFLVVLLSTGFCGWGEGTPPGPARERKLNNLVWQLIDGSSGPNSSAVFPFTRSHEGWVFVSAKFINRGEAQVILDPGSAREATLLENIRDEGVCEAMRHVAAGKHTLQVQCRGKIRLQKLAVKAIPELMHCGLGFDPQIKSYGHYDMNFLQRDILPNITSLIVPNHIQLAQTVIEEWHRQGKRFVAEVGVNAQAKTAEEHFKYWTSFFEKSPFLDGIIINEFIVNKPSQAAGATVSPERARRMEQEQQRHQVFGQALRQIRSDNRFQSKMIYAYVGGSGKRLNQEMIGTNFIPTILNCDYQIALERYLHEMSSPKGSREALDLFVDGIADWENKQPGSKRHLVIAFGLFSMPPGGLNKLPNVDYHVWMDQQMHEVANNPLLEGIAGFNWWTSLLADEETVRFVGKLYRHYAIEGRTNRLTTDPLFLEHIENADFERGTNGWILHAAEPESIQVKTFPRYGRIEGRFMGLGRPADPEHIGDQFLWMKRNQSGPNTFSQTIQNLQPGRLYSMKMFSCDYNDLVEPKSKTLEQASPFIGKVVLEDVDLDAKRSFTERYASTPEPKIPVWITYHWKVFRARAHTARVVVSDWTDEHDTSGKFGQEQTFNFVEIQPYRE